MPCFIPHASCPNCLSFDTMSLRAGSKKKIVVTKEGNYFNIKSKYILMNCNLTTEIGLKVALI